MHFRLIAARASKSIAWMNRPCERAWKLYVSISIALKAVITINPNTNYVVYVVVDADVWCGCYFRFVLYFSFLIVVASSESLQLEMFFSFFLIYGCCTFKSSSREKKTQKYLVWKITNKLSCNLITVSVLIYFVCCT